jgi:peptidylprolyl isomerase
MSSSPSRRWETGITAAPVLRAKKAGVYDAKERYGPRLVIIGEGRIIPGLEKAIRELNVGEEKEVEIPPSEAFGERKPENIKIMPRNVFIKSGVTPEPGKVVEINGKLAIIRSVTGGRVVVDFNHPLAGKKLLAKVKLVKIVDSIEDKVLYLLLRRLPSFITESDVKVSYNEAEKTVKAEFNEKALLVADMQTAKRIVVNEVKKYLGDKVARMEFIEKVKLQEEEKVKEETKEKTAAEEKASRKEQEASQG